jgi:hypothetical protein
MPLDWKDSLGALPRELDAAEMRFGHANIVYRGETVTIRWLNEAAMLPPFQREHLSQPMRTLKRRLLALHNSLEAVEFDQHNADSNLGQLNALMLRVSFGSVSLAPRLRVCVFGRRRLIPWRRRMGQGMTCSSTQTSSTDTHSVSGETRFWRWFHP